MSVVITYDGTELKYPATVSVSSEYIDYGSRWGAVQKVSIQGNVVLDSCSNDLDSKYSQLVGIQNSLFGLFQNDFKTLSVDDLDIDNCKLDSIDFQESNYYGAIGFTVSLTSYSGNYFNTANVTEPINLVTYSEQKNNSIQITHRVSARGINTATSGASNALQNARAYVNARVGYSTSLPQLSQVTNRQTYNLTNAIKPRHIVETIDRMNGSVSVEKTYVIKSGQTGDSTMFYTIDSSYDDEKGLSVGTIKGTVTGSIGQSIGGVRADFAKFSPFEKLNTYFQAMGHGALLNQPENVSVNENSRENTIEFSYTYNSIADVFKVFEKTFSMQYDYTTDKVSVNFSGKVEFRGSQAQKRYAAQTFTFTAQQAAQLCSSFYAENAKFAPTIFGENPQINPTPLTFEIKRDLINGVVTIAANCDNRIIPPDPNFNTFDYTLSVNASLGSHCSLQQFLDGGTSILNYKMKTRGEVSINGTAISTVTGLEEACLQMATTRLQHAIDAIGGLTDGLVVESKIESAPLPDDGGYIYSYTVTKTGLTGKTTIDFGCQF